MFHSNPRTKAGVDVIVSEKFRDAIKRHDDRLMKIHMPHNSGSQARSRVLSGLYSRNRPSASNEDFVIVADELNGHVGTEKNGNCAHGGFAFGERNADGERVQQCENVHELVVTN
ncbi:hypothetical protein ANCCAN_13495 [Ancylostoma caninum]|uniref:Uncharacterized protein n=1 Tax=Ancylostoma caninum TaxID=29170 RepID=A0A368G819_ANCCA|nr:hypothetical protein ANCCAN_13495 [Ancylostoma caninum]